MGLFNWLMKGMGFEEENGENASSDKQERKEKKKKRKEKREEASASEQMSFSGMQEDNNSFASNRDQFNTAGKFYAGDSSSYLGQQNMGGYGTKNVVFYYPKNYQDVQKIVDLLKQGESAIINLDGISDDEAQRMLDFVSGAVYALNGSTQRVSGNIFLLTPEGLNIMVPNEDQK
ncbi:MAG: cell division protein SepF [Clostridia bacterium]|nr:cell division protein SepF [Clostridia bacterium]